MERVCVYVVVTCEVKFCWIRESCFHIGEHLDCNVVCCYTV
jgi:hypothetical protein